MAEEDALKKAKEQQSAAGKSVGMSGRDLVRALLFFSFLSLLTPPLVPIQPRVVRRLGRRRRRRLGSGQIPQGKGRRGYCSGRGSNRRSIHFLKLVSYPSFLFALHLHFATFPLYSHIEHSVHLVVSIQTSPHRRSHNPPVPAPLQVSPGEVWVQKAPVYHHSASESLQST
jgi:hypothetical protein